MISRRTLLSVAGVGFALSVLTTTSTFGFASGGSLRIRVASVKFGSLSWLLKTIQDEGIDKKHNLEIDIVEIANNQSSPIALYGGNADVVVSDWTWALRQRSMGEALKFAPFSSALGAVVVPAASGIRSLADLKGKRLGVAGSAFDKSWLLLRAYSKKTTGTDIADVTIPQYGAAPLLAEQLKDERLDAVLNFWTYSARLEGLGFRRIIAMSDVMKELGVDPQPALVGFIWKEASETTLRPAIDALLAAVTEGNALLASSDVPWENLKPLMKASSDAEFASLRAAYRAGIPNGWSDGDMKSAEKIMSILVESGDSELVGNGTRFDPKLFHTSGT